MQSFIQRFDIICLNETHTIQKGSFHVKNFKYYNFPDTNCNYEHPRGGICICLLNIKLLMTDFIEMTFTNGLKLNNVYIPQVDSVYYNEQYI